MARTVSEKSVLHTKQTNKQKNIVGEKMVKKKKSSLKSVSSLITQWPSSGLGLLSRKEEITSNHVLKQNKVQEPSQSLQKSSGSGMLQQRSGLYSYYLQWKNKRAIIQENVNQITIYCYRSAQIPLTFADTNEYPSMQYLSQSI